jgi:hypothetical protein
VRDVVLGSLRAVRERAAGHPLPPGFEVRVEGGPEVAFTRTMLDGHRVRLTLAPRGGETLAVDRRGRVTASAAPGARALELTLTALTDAPPLTPIPKEQILAGDGDFDPQSRDALAFLAHEEKLLAGSWRFLTYFGRDTLLTLQMLMPVLGPAPVEAGLGSVLDRLGPGGEVAHEEALGEWAMVERRARGAGEREWLDYAMVDDDFLLAPALCRYLLDTKGGPLRAASFLARRTPSGVAYREAARRNLARVLELAAPFAADPSRAHLIALKPTALTGEWRDSDDGLGGGRVPYDVNAALVPAALEATARLYESPLLAPDPEAAARARAELAAWRDAASFFRVEIPAAEARRRVAAFAAERGYPRPDLASLEEPVILDALALDAAGAPLPVLHSDVAFRWMYDAPPAEELTRQAQRLAAPFPAGLLTPVGVVVANPAFADDPALAARFTPHDYHGTVVWSWQHALIAAGIRHQQERADLGPEARAALLDAERAVWRAVRATQADGLLTAELWSFTPQGGRLVLAPFGASSGDVDEANAVQLWSTALLALKPSWEKL